MRQVEKAMGTVFVVETPEETDGTAMARVFEWFEWVEDNFSTFRPHSEVSRIGRGEMSTDDCNPEVRGVLTRCEEMRSLTNGAFDHRPAEGRLDPSAFVKGWSVDRAGLILRLAGIDEWRINAGGDVLCSGGSRPTATTVGIRHPHDAQEIAAALAVDSGAIATSGEYERGAHIWKSASGPTLRSVTVVGPELGVADALATALFAASDPSPGWLRSFPGYGVVALTDNRCIWTSDLDELLIAPRPVPSECCPKASTA
jgi:thiamine biosynthesis lipoprotein